MNKLDCKIEKVIKKEGLHKDDIYFADYESFEELPLFSRWKYISFLKETSFDYNNKLLMSHAIRLSEHAMKISPDKLKEECEDYFCCVTLTKWDCVDEINCITPNLYITRRKNWLFSYLKLRQTHSKEEALTKKYINEIGLKNYEVYISGITDKDISRVYIINNVHNPVAVHGKK